ncbi:hypothetical protein K435DRAFT_972867 [Dendrothele bispora CBS 962.96]|uniref:Cyclase n=1 Tax=Dendrothele bispora (strain CBS 962.96) TaxID=1314807 RepID=A0A4S8KW61_DENBC|nr:hypothetical protein K435DRAFT_972867 [Dendrothele bispora CBS 962.96]
MCFKRLCALTLVLSKLLSPTGRPVGKPAASVSRQFNDSDIYANWPTYDQLPLDPSFPTKAAWGVWGATDELGALNHITPNTIKAARNEIGAGIAISLNLEMNIPNPPLNPLRPAMLHAIVPFQGYQDDIISLNTQISTQYDGLRHFPYSTNNRVSTYQFYNDLITFEDIVSPDRIKTLGIQNAAQKGIAGRGVLLDWGGWKESRNETFDALSEVNITSSDLDAVISWQGGSPESFIHPGDFLIIRSGFMKQYLQLPVPQEQVLPFRVGDDAAWVGLEPSDDTLRWLWDRKISVLGSDNPSVEKSPLIAVIGGVERSLHQIFIGGWGLSLVEYLDLESLAETCHKLNRFTFFFTLQNLNMAGGIASPPNAMAIL